ncbi:MAG: AI-2E family transporter [Anaerolineae bacterium]|jgi:predicted PurR-regulated permease PerM|nr:AI-2E family transporter [Anaerolineae bacterium]MDH7474586.1 AI-2E family transporter [Anaerolineae bacterium]
MEQNRLLRTTLTLVTLAALVFLFERLWMLVSRFGDIIVMLTLAWLLAFILRPTVDWLTNLRVPPRLVNFIRRHWNERAANVLSRFHLSYRIAAATVYIGLLVIIVLIGIYLVPVTTAQLVQLGRNLPDYFRQVPGLLAGAQTELARWNIRLDLGSFYDQKTLIQRAEAIGAIVIQNTVLIVRQVTSAVVNIFLVLVLGFYMTLDARRLGQRAFELVPAEYQDEVAFAGRSLDRTFGGFVRGQLLMAALYGVFVIIAMTVAQASFAVAVGIISGLVMLIPIIGAPIGMFLPPTIALFQNPTTALWLLLATFLYQQFLLNFLVPRIMSEMVGMSPILVLAALMISVRLIGFWGFIFGIPVVAALYAMGIFFLERFKREKDNQKEEKDV